MNSPGTIPDDTVQRVLEDHAYDELNQFAGALADLRKVLVDEIQIIAQAVHRAYHRDGPEDVTWRECPKHVCARARYAVAKAAEVSS